MKNSQIHRVTCLVSLMSVIAPFVVAVRLARANDYHLDNATGVLTMIECLDCHDEFTGRSITGCLGDSCVCLGNHPLMLSYPPQRKQDEYASRAEIEQAGCVLEDGKITCLSCHNLTKPSPHLVRSGDNLCYICHTARRPRGYLPPW